MKISTINTLSELVRKHREEAEANRKACDCALGNYLMTSAMASAMGENSNDAEQAYKLRIDLEKAKAEAVEAQKLYDDFFAHDWR